MPRLLPFASLPHGHVLRSPSITVSPELAQFINDIQILAIMDKEALAHIAAQAHRIAIHARKRRRPR